MAIKKQDILYKKGKRLATLLVGGTIFIFGIALIFLPGPAIIVIPLGLMILGTEFVWAKKWLNKLRDRTGISIRR
jgi:tellurite resistance protein TerC